MKLIFPPLSRSCDALHAVSPAEGRDENQKALSNVLANVLEFSGAGESSLPSRE